MLNQFVRLLLQKMTIEHLTYRSERRDVNIIKRAISVIFVCLLSHNVLAVESREFDFQLKFDVNLDEFSHSFYHLGGSVFENVIFTLDFNLLDAMVKKQLQSEECFGILSSYSKPLNLSIKSQSTVVNLSEEDLDALNQEMLENSEFKNRFQIENIEISLKGKGVYPNGYWFKAMDREDYHEDYKESDLPFISFETLKDIVERNKMFLMRRSLVDSRFHVNSIKTNLKKSRFRVEGVVEVRSYINGHSFIELEHDMTFDLKKIEYRFVNLPTRGF